MEKAGKLARKKYEDEHPEMLGQKMKYDPFKALKQGKNINLLSYIIASSGSRNLSEGADDSRNLRPCMATIFFLTSFKQGREEAPRPLDLLLIAVSLLQCFATV